MLCKVAPFLVRLHPGDLLKTTKFHRLIGQKRRKRSINSVKKKKTAVL